jgi:hypothetical protein
MTTLTIRRLGAEVPADLDQTSPARVERLLRLVADRALEDRHPTYGELSGEWCVRRLDLQLDLAADEPDSSAAARWAEQIAGAIRDLVPDGSNVLHFRSRSRLLLDLVVGIVSADLSRTWAWQQAGLLTATDPDPANQPGAAVVTAVGREPRLALPVLIQAVQRAGVRAVHAVLGPAGWSAVADLVRPGWRLPPFAAVQTGDAGAALPARAAAVLASSTLARAVWSTAPASDAVTRSAWAALVLAEADPAGGAALLPWISAGLAGGALANPVAELRATSTTAVTAGSSADTSTAPATGRPDAAPVHSAHEPGALHDDDVKPAHVDATRTSEPPIDRDQAGGFDEPARSTAANHDAKSAPERSGLGSPAPAPMVDTPSARAGAQAAPPGPVPFSAEPVAPSEQETAAAETGSGAATNWAALLFLLNATKAAGLPDVLEADVRLAGRPLRWVLHQLALRLVPIRAEDPAALALAGLTPAMPVPAGIPAEKVEEEALEQHTSQWAATVRQLLESARHPDDDTPIPTLWSLARRPGRIVADPGWLEVQLDLDDIDLLVRRAGLDLDPGWLGWLGTVVVFRYV